MVKRIVIFLVAVSFFLIGFSGIGVTAKAMYEYKCKNGVLSYTDDYDNIPVNCRKTAKKVVLLPDQAEESLNKPLETISAPINTSSITTATNPAVVNTAPSETATHGNGLMDETWFKIAGGGSGFTALVLLGMKLGAMTGNKILGGILGLIMAGGLMMYMFNDNLERLMESFKSAKDDVGVVQKIMDHHVDKVNRMTNEK